MAQKFDDQPHPVSDIPEGHLGGLSWEEAKLIAERRFERAGSPVDKLQAWLDDHEVYPKRAEPPVRVYSLDWFQMLGLMAATADWWNEKREEDNPYMADLA